MKKVLAAVIICLLCITFLGLAPGVMAEGEQYYYVKQATDFIILDNSQGLSGNFNLPATWYVKATPATDITEGDITYKVVEYNGVKGKVDASMLSKKTTALATQPYFKHDIVSIDPLVGSVVPLYSNYECTTSLNGKTIPKGSTITVLATASSNGEITYLLSYMDSNTKLFAFAQQGLLKNETVLVGENPNKSDPDQIANGDDLTVPPKDDGATTPANNLLRILLIVAICVIAVLLVFLIFKPTSKKAKNDDFYEDYRGN